MVGTFGLYVFFTYLSRCLAITRCLFMFLLSRLLLTPVNIDAYLSVENEVILKIKLQLIDSTFVLLS